MHIKGKCYRLCSYNDFKCFWEGKNDIFFIQSYQTKIIHQEKKKHFYFAQ